MQYDKWTKWLIPVVSKVECKVIRNQEAPDLIIYIFFSVFMRTMFSSRTRWAAEHLLLAGPWEIKWSCAFGFFYCQIFTLRARTTQTRAQVCEFQLYSTFAFFDEAIDFFERVWETTALHYLSESESQDRLSFCRSSSEWNFLKPLRWTAWATE